MSSIRLRDDRKLNSKLVDIIYPSKGLWGKNTQMGPQFNGGYGSTVGGLTCIIDPLITNKTYSGRGYTNLLSYTTRFVSSWGLHGEDLGINSDGYRVTHLTGVSTNSGLTAVLDDNYEIKPGYAEYTIIEVIFDTDVYRLRINGMQGMGTLTHIRGNLYSISQTYSDSSLTGNNTVYLQRIDESITEPNDTLVSIKRVMSTNSSVPLPYVKEQADPI